MQYLVNKMTEDGGMHLNAVSQTTWSGSSFTWDRSIFNVCFKLGHVSFKNTIHHIIFLELCEEEFSINRDSSWKLPQKLRWTECSKRIRWSEHYLNIKHNLRHILTWLFSDHPLGIQTVYSWLPDFLSQGLPPEMPDHTHLSCAFQLLSSTIHYPSLLGDCTCPFLPWLSVAGIHRGQTTN